jgi:hypothetical protein
MIRLFLLFHFFFNIFFIISKIRLREVPKLRFGTSGDLAGLVKGLPPFDPVKNEFLELPLI